MITLILFKFPQSKILQLASKLELLYYLKISVNLKIIMIKIVSNEQISNNTIYWLINKLI